MWIVLNFGYKCVWLYLAIYNIGLCCTFNIMYNISKFINDLCCVSFQSVVKVTQRTNILGKNFETFNSLSMS